MQSSAGELVYLFFPIDLLFLTFPIRGENGSSMVTILILASSVQRFDALCSSCHRRRDMANIKRLEQKRNFFVWSLIGCCDAHKTKVNKSNPFTRLYGPIKMRQEICWERRVSSIPRQLFLFLWSKSDCTSSKYSDWAQYGAVNDVWPMYTTLPPDRIAYKVHIHHS